MPQSSAFLRISAPSSRYSFDISGAYSQHAIGPEPLGIIVVEGLTYALPDGQPLLEGLQLNLQRLRYGLVGVNGVGKSTLARLIAGELEPTRGRVVRRGRVAVFDQSVHPTDDVLVADVLQVRPSLEALYRLEGRALPASSGAVGGQSSPVMPETLSTQEYERLLEQLGDQWDLEQRIQSACRDVGLPSVDPFWPFNRLSGGQQTRLRLAACLLQSPDLLILDEPTNHLDLEGRGALLAFLKLWPHAALVISHDRTLLDCMDVILELTPLGLSTFGGNFSDYREMKDTLEAAERQRLQSAEQIALAEKRVAQLALERQERRNARGKKNRDKEGVSSLILGKMKRRAEVTTARSRLLHESRIQDAEARLSELKARELPERHIQLDLSASSMASRALPEPSSPRGRLETARLSSRRKVLTLKEVTFAYPGAEPLLDGFSLTLQGPERVAITGPNGSGKTTLFRLVRGELTPQLGRVETHGVRIATLSQQGEDLHFARSVLEQYQEATPELDLAEQRMRLGRFLFKGDEVHKKVGQLSGGERMRLSLACTLAKAPQLLILDEPTNNLDFDALEALESALKRFPGALLVSSHDPYFLQSLALDRVVALPGPETTSTPAQ